jgi:glycosyltransferase involved in cell wall biosynthesis
MRIVIDFQGAQSTGSRTRGIGRYTVSLAEGLLRNQGEHEVFLVLNGLFPETIEPIRSRFRGLISDDHILVWDAPGPADYLGAPSECRLAAEAVRELFLAQLMPNVVIVSSLFEGLGDSAITSVGSLAANIPTAVILYDLIPFINRSPYLENRDLERWYFSKLDHLRRADLLLAISESSRKEAIDYLGWKPEAVATISTAADPQFVPRKVSADRRASIYERYGLNRSFIMYTGGIDFRKNIEGLVYAYAKLSDGLRNENQLAIVCSIQELDRQRLLTLAREHGLSPQQLVITGYVPEDDLIDLYNMCSLFVFPSWHEGFGLPALEAMSCGAAVIGANTSSVPEVLGREVALFDPRDYDEIANKMRCVLTDAALHSRLSEDGLMQARKFSWDVTAKRAILALERHFGRTEKIFASNKRPRLAYISPLKPTRTGISEYSAELLPELSRHYDIEVVIADQVVDDPYVNACFPVRSIDWFRANSFRYDRVLYHFGNSAFHIHMFGLVKEIPGVVVLHDFFLSGALHYMDVYQMPPNALARELYSSHGYGAVAYRFKVDDVFDVLRRYPCSLSVLQDADGVIVHSKNSLRLAQSWYGSVQGEKFEVIPLPRATAQRVDRSTLRSGMGIEHELVVCSFGFIAPSKLTHLILEAWSRSTLVESGAGKLILVGANEEGAYGQDVLKLIRDLHLEKSVIITGWIDSSDFHKYLAACDIAVQLRTDSRGETSAAVLDCLSYGIATIVNANGSMAELDEDCVVSLPDKFEVVQLTRALDLLAADTQLRSQLGGRARECIRIKHAPRDCADQYFEAIERFSVAGKGLLRNFTSRVGGFEKALNNRELADLSTIVARNRLRTFSCQRLLIDVTALASGNIGAGIFFKYRAVLARHLVSSKLCCRIEPIQRGEGAYFYARSWTSALLGIPKDVLPNERVELTSGDIYLGVKLLAGSPNNLDYNNFQRLLKSSGVQVRLFDCAPDEFDSAITEYEITYASEILDDATN